MGISVSKRGLDRLFQPRGLLHQKEDRLLVPSPVPHGEHEGQVLIFFGANQPYALKPMKVEYALLLILV
jgi:hypothetical protein